MNLDPESFAALLFDLDGTLIDSMPLHNRAWLETLAEAGHELDERVLRELAGVPTIQTVAIFNERFGWNLDPLNLARKKEDAYLRNLHLVRPVDEVVRVARDHFGRIPLALVTGGSRGYVEMALGLQGLAGLFAATVCAEDTLTHKPSPEPFLRAARILDVDPRACLVFEDGEAGIRGARAAGMRIVKVSIQTDEGQRRSSLVLTQS